MEERLVFSSFGKACQDKSNVFSESMEDPFKTVQVQQSSNLLCGNEKINAGNSIVEANSEGIKHERAMRNENIHSLNQDSLNSAINLSEIESEELK